MIELNTNPSPRDLRYFAGLWFPALGLVVTGLLWKAGWTRYLELWIAFVVGFSVLGLIRTAWIRPIFVGLTYLTFPIGWVISHLLMIGVFYGMMFPMGLLMRLLRYDPLRRKLDRDSATYWIERPESTPTRRYFRQF